MSDHPQTQQITVQDLTFTAPARYSEGHVLKANEASALNQLLAENLRNNFASVVKKAKEESGGNPDLATLQAQFDERAAAYEFGARRGGGGGTSAPRDPVEREAYSLARDIIRAAAKKQNVTLDATQVNEKIPALLEKYPNIREEAQRRVDQAAAISIEELELPTTEADTVRDPDGNPPSDEAPAQGAEAEGAEASSGRRGRRAA